MGNTNPGGGLGGYHLFLAASVVTDVIALVGRQW